MCSDKEFNWVWNSAEITPFVMASVFQPSCLRNDSLIKIIFAQLKRPNKIMFGFFSPGEFSGCIKFLFLNNKQSIPPSLDNRLNSRRKFDRHLGIDYDWSVDIQSGSHHQSRPPSCLFSFHLENRRTNPPPSPPTPLMLQFSFIPLSSPQRIWSSLNSCYQTSYRFGWLCAWTAWRTRMSFLHLIFRS